LVNRHEGARAALPVLDDLLPNLHGSYSTTRINAQEGKRFG
jgi:hypothetical protein